METTKHTPGPWEIHGGTSEKMHYIHGANRICDITKPSGFYRSPRETDANASLMAAAPQMYEALEAIEDLALRDWKCYSKADVTHMLVLIHVKACDALRAAMECTRIANPECFDPRR